jgi:hypothetical protein
MQGQTKSQLQVSTYRPLMFHAGVVIALPQSVLGPPPDYTEL